MKKHKSIGVVIALIVVALTAATGFVWYKNNVYIGAKEVKAAEATGACKNFSVSVKNEQHDKFPTSGPGSYTAYAYAVKGSIAKQIINEWKNVEDKDNIARTDVKTLNEWYQYAQQNNLTSEIIPLMEPKTFSNSGTVDLTKEINQFQKQYDTASEYYYEVVEVFETEADTKYFCGSRNWVPIPEPTGPSTDPNREICSAWVNNRTGSYELEGTKINTPIEKFKDNEGVIDNFMNLKSQMENVYCPGGSDSLTPKQVASKIAEFEENFNKWAEVASKNVVSTDTSFLGDDLSLYQDVRELGAKIKGDNGGIELETLYCKTNSVYLKDAAGAEGVDRLEQSGTNKYALQYQDREKRVADVSDGNARANLYLFKYVAPEHVEPYTPQTISNGEVVDKDTPEVTAGMCFGYSVQVIAFTQCDYEALPFTPDVPQPSSVQPRCHEGESIGAGPTEEFEQCVMSCDGGKYTSECSNKCLDKINKAYGGKKMDKSTKQGQTFTSSSEKVLGTFMADKDNNNWCSSVPSVAEINNMVAAGNREGAVNLLHSFFLEHPSGYYDYAGGSIVFRSNCPGKYWAQYAPYYYTSPKGFQTMTDHDIHLNRGYDTCHDATHCEVQAPSCTIGGHCSDNSGGGNGGAGYLVDVNDGCDRNNENPSCEKRCNTDCYFSNESGGEFVSSALVTEAVNTSYDRYVDALSKCSATALCKSNGTNESTFYITVDENEETNDYKWHESNSTNGTEHPQIPENGAENSGCQNTQPGGNYHIIEGRESTSNELQPGTGGLCYCGNTEYDGWHHYTRWTFPGSWINIKNNEVLTEEPSENEKDSYEGGYNQYCVPPTAEDINEQWHQEYLNLRYNGKCGDLNRDDVEARQLITTEDVKYNIHAKTEHFGNYDWTLSTACFYSSHASPDGIELSDEGTPENTDIICEEEAKAASEFRTKTVDLENVLPNGKGEADKVVTFNWSDSGTKLDIGDNYAIVPGAYKKYVETQGDAIFDDENLDYEFTLSGNDMRDIASHNVKYGDFSSSRDSKAISDCDNNSQSYCLRTIKSSLIDKLVGQSSKNKRPSLDDLRCNNISPDGGCDSFEEYWSEYVRWMNKNRNCGLTGTCQKFN